MKFNKVLHLDRVNLVGIVGKTIDLENYRIETTIAFTENLNTSLPINLRMVNAAHNLYIGVINNDLVVFWGLDGYIYDHSTTVVVGTKYNIVFEAIAGEGKLYIDGVLKETLPVTAAIATVKESEFGGGSYLPNNQNSDIDFVTLGTETYNLNDNTGDILTVVGSAGTVGKIETNNENGIHYVKQYMRGMSGVTGALKLDFSEEDSVNSKIYDFSGDYEVNVDLDLTNIGVYAYPFGTYSKDGGDGVVSFGIELHAATRLIFKLGASTSFTINDANENFFRRMSIKIARVGTTTSCYIDGTLVLTNSDSLPPGMTTLLFGLGNAVRSGRTGSFSVISLSVNGDIWDFNTISGTSILAGSTPLLIGTGHADGQLHIDNEIHLATTPRGTSGALILADAGESITFETSGENKGPFVFEAPYPDSLTRDLNWFSFSEGGGQTAFSDTGERAAIVGGTWYKNPAHTGVGIYTGTTGFGGVEFVPPISIPISTQVVVKLELTAAVTINQYILVSTGTVLRLVVGNIIELSGGTSLILDGKPYLDTDIGLGSHTIEFTSTSGNIPLTFVGSWHTGTAIFPGYIESVDLGSAGFIDFTIGTGRQVIVPGQTCGMIQTYSPTGVIYIMDKIRGLIPTDDTPNTGTCNS